MLITNDFNNFFRFEVKGVSMRALSDARLFLITGFVLFITLFATLGVASAAETVDRIVAIVNEDIIRLKELDAAFEPVARQIYAENYEPEKEQKVLYEKRIEVLNQLIEETLADQVIQQKGITVSSTEIDNAIEQIKSRNYYTDEDLQRYLSMSGMDMEAYRDEIRQQILRSKLMNQEVKSSIVITESDIREYYESHAEKYKPKPTYRLKNIFVSHGEASDDDGRPQARQKIEDAMAALNNSHAFEDVAEEYSEAGNATDGGELGNFEISDLQEEIQPVIQKLAPGEFSSIVETDRGFQIFYLQEIVTPSDKSFDSVAGEIRNILYEQAVEKKFDDWMDTLRSESHIKIIR